MNAPPNRKGDANKRNAQKSTGPRTASGKVRSSQNARRHGLATPISCDPTWKETSTAIYNQIVDLFFTDEQKALCLRVAERQCEILRTRKARQAAIEQAFSKRRYTPSLVDLLGEPLCRWMANAEMARGRSAETMDHYSTPKLKSEPESNCIAVSEVIGDMNRLDRYERRAHSAMRKDLGRLKKMLFEQHSVSREANPTKGKIKL